MVMYAYPHRHAKWATITRGKCMVMFRTSHRHAKRVTITLGKCMVIHGIAMRYLSTAQYPCRAMNEERDEPLHNCGFKLERRCGVWATVLVVLLLGILWYSTYVMRRNNWLYSTCLMLYNICYTTYVIQHMLSNIYYATYMVSCNMCVEWHKSATIFVYIGCIRVDHNFGWHVKVVRLSAVLRSIQWVWKMDAFTI